MVAATLDPRINDKLVNSISNRNPLIVIAGHYSMADYLEEVSNTGDAEIASFKAGVSLVKQTINSGKTSHLVLLINDIGIDKTERDKVKADYKLPDNYSEIMAKEDLEDNYLTVIFESAIRNKASAMLRKLYKKKPYMFERIDSSNNDLCRCVEKSGCANNDNSNTAYVIEGPNGEKLVVKEGPNPKCNLILATFFNDICDLFRPELIVNFFNDIYQNRIHLGIHVGRKILDISLPFINIFCDGDHIVTVQGLQQETNGYK